MPTFASDVLAGRTALVSGGGAGIGRAVALALAAAGARVAVGARDVGRAQEVAERCGGSSLALPLDVTDEASCRDAVARLEVEILVNNAGVASSSKFTDLDDATWQHTLEVNLTGAFRLTRAALPGMLARGRGRVVSIASTAGHVGHPYVAAYTASKHALVGLTRSLAAEYAKSGVTFNCVCPGYVDTPMTERTVENIAARTGRSPEDAQRALHTPQGRLIDPQEVADLCVYLASDAAASVTGQAIVLDGGAVQA
jgi:3-hydroxybutyrate dehydrogenase